jgi:hypothetical protein
MRNRVAWVRITGIVLGMLMFLSANYARSLPCGFQQFPLSQLWKFQRIIHLIGLGVVVASMAGKYIDWTLDKNPPAPVISRAQCRTFKISQSGREAAPEP